MSANYLTMKPLVFPCVNTFNWSKACVLKEQASKQKTPNPPSGLPYSKISECLTLQCGHYRPLVWLNKFRRQGQQLELAVYPG